MPAKEIFGIAFIVATVIWVIIMQIWITRTARRNPPIVPKLPTIPEDCIEALRTRAECPGKNKTGGNHHGKNQKSES